MDGTIASPSLRLPAPEIDALLSTLDDWVQLKNLEPHDDNALSSLHECLLRLRHVLLDASNHLESLKDVFRRSGGFERLLETLTSLRDSLDAEPLSALTLQVIKTLLFALSEALYGHPRNQEYFAALNSFSGWGSVETFLAPYLVASKPSNDDKHWQCSAQLFDILLDVALNDESSGSIFLDSSPFSQARSIRSIDKVRATLGPSRSLLHPGLAAVALSLSFSLFEAFYSSESKDDASARTEFAGKDAYRQIVSNVSAAFSHVTQSSEYNLVALHGTGILGVVLNVLQRHVRASTDLQEVAILAQDLLCLGLHDLNDTSRLLSAAESNSRFSSLLLGGITTSSQPARFVFDMSFNGYASLEFADLGTGFPPQDESNGYTLMMWMRVDKFDDSCHTTIFGVSDPSQTCFTLLYLERQSHHLVLQTSILSTNPSVRFKKVTFKENRLYHIALVHLKPRREGSGLAMLFVDGILRDKVKCPLPRPPPVMTARNTGLRTPKNIAPVQAFFGTPHDLSPHLGSTLVSTWSMGSAHLFSVALPEELILVCEKLGPSYNGNFQDCLGSFQTYSASAVLNLRNEVYHAGREDDSLISAAVRNVASSVNPEHTLLISISPKFVHKNAKAALRTREASANGLYAPIVANAAVPDCAKAMAKKTGFASIMGGVVVLQPVPLQESIWRLSGVVPSILKIVAEARSAQNLVYAVQIFIEMFRESWRNSESLERNNGYGLLAMFLQCKLAFTSGEVAKDTPTLAPIEDVIASKDWLPIKLLRMIIHATSLNFDDQTSAIIINPLAYRLLVVDNELWLQESVETQIFFFDQLVLFATHSRNKTFNLKRLTRMRIFKRIIEILKTNKLSKEVAVALMRSLRALLQSSATSDTFRSLALYITYSLGGDVPRTPEEVSRSNLEQLDVLSNTQLGVLVLQLLKDFICADSKTVEIQRFSRSVTTKWLLHLLLVEDPDVVVPAFTILSRMLIVGGEGFRSKFESKSGYVILQKVLQRWHDQTQVWLICFVLLFGLDSERLNLLQLSDLARWFSNAGPLDDLQVFCPGIWDAIIAMLGTGMDDAIHRAIDDISNDTDSRAMLDTHKDRSPLRYVINLISAIYSEAQAFRDFAASQDIVRDVLRALFMSIADATDTFDESSMSDAAQSIHDTATEASRSEDAVFLSSSVDLKRQPSPAVSDSVSRLSISPVNIPIRVRRSSSYIVLPPNPLQDPATLLKPLAPTSIYSDEAAKNDPCFRDVSRLLTTVSVDHILHQKDFAGLGLFLKAPSASNEKRSWIISYVQTNILDALTDRISTDPTVFQHVRALTNLVRLVHHAYEAALEGWFVDPTCSLIRFIVVFLTHIQRRDIRIIKSVRLCTPLLGSIQTALASLTLFRMSEADSAIQHETSETIIPETVFSVTPETEATEREKCEDTFFNMLTQITSVLQIPVSAEGSLEGPLSTDSRFLAAFLYLLYRQLVCGRASLHSTTLQVFRNLAAPYATEVQSMLKCKTKVDTQSSGELLLGAVFRKTDKEVISLIQESYKTLNELFSERPRAALLSLINEHNLQCQKSSKVRIRKRKERLHLLHLEDLAQQHAWTEHEASTRPWNENIYNSETLKTSRARQDRQDNMLFLQSVYGVMQLQTQLFEGSSRPLKWALDETEGRDRMRLRLKRTEDSADLEYRPKRSARSNTLPSKASAQSLDLRQRSTTGPAIRDQIGMEPENASSAITSAQITNGKAQQSRQEDGFEMIDNPDEADTDLEDRNRKVMRSLQRGEHVINVYNVSRIRGLEACESLMIIGKKALYLVDNLFQRADGEVVYTSQTPPDERDRYVQMIAGREVRRDAPKSVNIGSSTRHWPWTAIISISKRSFLLRSVALEIFFADGRSYLLTTMSSRDRNELYTNLTSRSSRLQNPSASTSDPEAWRLELLPNPKEPPPTMAGRFVNALSFASSLAATAKWVKGEMSNFQYLMIINTMAGRTFNDLTQYPVFPWVLSDYTSEELDLTNPRSFRDFSKPMGSQKPEREAAFRERYNSFADMGDDSTPAFHYGTHYSSAMIVTSYLIRLQPYVDSYLLLQGGNFDHADRLFYSIEMAWSSASETNMSDVRELTPEFYYLPEFLTNRNKYDFGRREANAEQINDVKLPPWAKGDPNLFIRKHREALESPHVSRNLHQWIDLVFGFKQRGEAAVEATNLFHYLSYQGSKDLDTIEDPMERMATIGIIHNFGQTPRQVFSRPHEQREAVVPRAKRLHRAIDSWAKLPAPIYEYHSTICELEYAQKAQKLLFCGPKRTLMAPSYNIVAEWGHVDGSLRFFHADTKKCLGLYEQLHQEDITTAKFADTTLITASKDCTVGLWNISVSSDAVTLQPRTFLHGHRHPVNVIAVSKTLSTIVSVDATGRIILWDLNTGELIGDIEARCEIKSVQINNTTGHLLLVSGQCVLLYTINGELLVNQSVCSSVEDLVSCCAFYETSGNDWVEAELIFTGHQRGIANAWKVVTDDFGVWMLQLARRLEHVDRSRLDGALYTSAITAIRPLDHLVYTGDEKGRVFEWACVR